MIRQPRFWPLAALALAAQVHAGARDEALLASPAWKSFVALVQDNHVTPVDARTLEAGCRRGLQAADGLAAERPIERCLRAAVEALGGHSAYLSPKEVAAQSPEAIRRTGGVGLEMRSREGSEGPFEIVSPLKGSPAQRAGLRPGDLVEAIDGVSTRWLTLAQAVAALRGEAGTRVGLRVARPGTDATLRLELVREPIAPPATVRALRVSPATVYLRIARFTNATPREAVAAMAGLGARNLVLDLRGCQGGLLDATVGVAALFVPPGTPLLASQGRRQDANRTFRAPAQDPAGKPWSAADEAVLGTLRAARLAILTDERTAAGAEAVVQALREQRRAVVIGQPSFGATTVETVLALEGGGDALRLSTATLQTPSGRSWGGGIAPDIALPAPGNRRFELGDPRSDAALARALAHLAAPP